MLTIRITNPHLHLTRQKTEIPPQCNNTRRHLSAASNKKLMTLYARRYQSTPRRTTSSTWIKWNLLEFPGRNGKMMKFIRKVATMEVHSRARGGWNMKKRRVINEFVLYFSLPILRGVIINQSNLRHCRRRPGTPCNDSPLNVHTWPRSKISKWTVEQASAWLLFFYVGRAKRDLLERVLELSCFHEAQEVADAIWNHIDFCVWKQWTCGSCTAVLLFSITGTLFHTPVEQTTSDHRSFQALRVSIFVAVTAGGRSSWHKKGIRSLEHVATSLRFSSIDSWKNKPNPAGMRIFSFNSNYLHLNPTISSLKVTACRCYHGTHGKIIRLRPECGFYFQFELPAPKSNDYFITRYSKSPISWNTW